MKARNKKTGEVVTSFSISKEFGTACYIDSANTLRFSIPVDGEWEIIDESEPTDWSSFRREAAKDILCALCTTLPIDMRQYVKQAINITDELIRQLKQE